MASKDDLVLVSVDDHICEPADMFEGHVPDRYREFAPRVVDEPNGAQQWYYGDVRGRNLGLNAVAGKPPEMFNVNPNRYEDMRPGCFDVHERVRDFERARALLERALAMRARRAPDTLAHAVVLDNLGAVYQHLGELGPAEAERTIVLIAHHDAAHSGIVFHPQLPHIADRLGLIERSDTSPPLMAPVVGGPALAALGALGGRRLLTKLGVLLGLGTAAAMTEIGLRDVVPGANDNGTAVVALLALAEQLLAEPTDDLRVILLSVGSEESFSEGIKAFGERHFGELPRESTFFLCLETLGSPNLLVLRGEGFLKMREYPPRALALMDGLAEEHGIPLFPNLRLRNGTDGLEPLAAGYETAVLASCTDLKQPANYHWWHDLAENVDFDTVAAGIRLAETAIRRLDQRWL